MKSTKLAACIKLAHKVTVYVPGTVGAASAGDTSEWIARAASLLSSRFGGATSSPAVGYWLSDGALICIEKPAIKTRFCFGYHANVHYTEEISTAEEAAAHAAKSQEYFITKNLESMDAMLKALENSETGIRPRYSGTAESTKICALVFPEPWEPVPTGYRRLLPEDREKLREAYRTERGEFAARLDAYLKRYGLSKVETWTYWLEE